MRWALDANHRDKNCLCSPCVFTHPDPLAYIYGRSCTLNVRSVLQAHVYSLLMMLTAYWTGNLHVPSISKHAVTSSYSGNYADPIKTMLFRILHSCFISCSDNSEIGKVACQLLLVCGSQSFTGHIFIALFYVFLKPVALNLILIKCHFLHSKNVMCHW